MVNYYELRTEEDDISPSKSNPPSSYIPNNFTIPIWKLQRPPVISHKVPLESQEGILPEMLVVVSEFQAHEGQIHLGPKASKEVSQQMLLNKRGGQQGRIFDEIRNNRNKETAKFYRPALEPVVIEQDILKDLEPISKDLSLARSIEPYLKRWKEIRQRKKSISQQPSYNGVGLKYVHVKEDLYPRRVDGYGRLRLIPMFQFPERIINCDDIIWMGNTMVFSKTLSRDMLEHCVLLIDHNDYLLNDLSNFTTLPTEGQSLGVTSIDLVKNHLIHGRWVWITREVGDCRRNIMVDRSANLHDARLMYILSTDSKQMPNRIEPLACFTRCSGRTWDSWERRDFQMRFHIPLIRERLYRWVHSSKFAEGDGGPLAWITFGDNNVLARFLRLENHQFHTQTTALSLGKRTDDSPDLDLVSWDSGYGASLKVTNTPGGSSTSKGWLQINIHRSGKSSPIDSAFQSDPKSADEITPAQMVPQVYHQDGCHKVGVPGFVCACPGPSSLAGLQIPQRHSKSSESSQSQEPEATGLDLSSCNTQQAKGSNPKVSEIAVPGPSSYRGLRFSGSTMGNKSPQCPIETIFSNEGRRYSLEGYVRRIFWLKSSPPAGEKFKFE
ncbi:hypothetical protein DSL72_004042 [Monilinia vaccinii-corymbosi]|uniref:Uncharacterized protein n=1 Tax=Monilinia vaccinii-corymbosi TaxID=61207 RepID=A0A8A3P6U9_9HELO|nr:hypothetical protein DSL72_004042 [Monilinia vaccinii-corymbosi]